MATKKNGSPPKTTRLETEKRRCAVKLTDAELVKRGDEMADCEVAVEALKASRSELARQVKTHEKRRNELGHALEAGVEDRDLVCTWHPDYKQNAFLLKRPDTGETIDTRPMSASDLNVELWPAPAAAAPTADAAALPPPPPRSPRPRKAKVTALHPRATAATPTPAA